MPMYQPGLYQTKSYRPPARDNCQCPPGWYKIGTMCCYGESRKPCVPCASKSCFYQKGCTRGIPCNNKSPKIPVPCTDFRCNVGPCDSLSYKYRA